MDTIDGLEEQREYVVAERAKYIRGLVGVERAQWGVIFYAVIQPLTKRMMELNKLLGK